MRTHNRDCSGCRYWSEMVACVDDLTLKALCLAPTGKFKGKYVAERTICDSFAMNTCGAVDDPLDYGAAVRNSYDAQARAKHPNGTPMFAPDGTMLDDKGGILIPESETEELSQ